MRESLANYRVSRGKRIVKLRAQSVQSDPEVIPTMPNAKQHNPSPAHLRALLVAANVSQRSFAVRIGVNERTVRQWLAPGGKVPYLAQFAAECLKVEIG